MNATLCLKTVTTNQVVDAKYIYIYIDYSSSFLRNLFYATESN